VVQTHRVARGSRDSGATEVHLGQSRPEYSLFGWATPGLAAWRAQRDRQSQAELVRLLYVAMTRAKRRLVISGGRRDPSKRVDPERARSFGDLLLSRRGGAGPLREVARRREASGEEPETGVRWVLPALEDLTVRQAAVSGGGSAVDSAEARSESSAIGRDRAAANRRMALRFSAAASAEAEARAEAFDADPDDRPSMRPRDRRVAMAVGSLVHEALEALDVAGHLVDQLREHRPAMELRLAADLGSDLLDEATDRLASTLDRIEHGACLSKLEEIGPQVVARELSLLLPADRVFGVVGSVAGSADLVYRRDGCLVVADYKTDSVITEDDVRAAVERYRPQLELYARALEHALGLSDPPAMELWFLHADRIVSL
jgi:ATP-dependent exoDNAse (exonuclease V) beta subunit